MRERAAGLIKEYDVRGGGRDVAGHVAVGRQPAEGRHRPRDRLRPARARRRAAHARPRRRRDRVRPPPADRRARRGPRRSCSSRWSSRRSARWPTASSSSTRARSSASSRPTPPRRSSGIAMTGGGRRPRRPRERGAAGRPGAGGRGRPGGGAGHPGRAAGRLRCRAAGVIVPVLTALLAFFIGGLVILVTGHNPISTYKAIFNGTGLNWLFPWVTGDERATAALNLQQTLILTTPLILTGLAVAFAFRCGPVQHRRPGPVPRRARIVAVWVGSSFAGMPKLLHVVLAIVAATLAGAAWAGIAGLLKATVGRPRGDLDDHAQLDRDLGRQLPVRARRAAAEQRPRAAVGAGLQRRRRRAPSCTSSGAIPSCRACTSGSSSRSRRCSSSGSSSTARPPATRCARSA